MGERKPKTLEAQSGLTKKVPEDDFLIVGVGASAGGIQALKQFFSRVPPLSNMAYVVILHMSPEYESKLAEILQNTSSIPVKQVQSQEKIRPNHVYVIPPNRSLEMKDGHVAPTERIGLEERRSPIDLFFRTLADTNDSRAVSVILSGTGSDGSTGIKRIKEHGGVSFAQDPNEAEYSDMPKNAIATGMVDHVLPVSEIPAKIIAYKDHRAAVQRPEPETAIEPADGLALRDIFHQVRTRTGHDFSNYKRGTMMRRIERRMGLKGLPDLTAYAHFMREHVDEARALMKDLLISVTSFFRDPDSIEALERRILPRLLERKGNKRNVRVWIAGCATGEEAYTMAMMLCEAAENSPRAVQVQLFATDLDEDAIAIAREGYYTDADVAEVSPERLRRFFVRESDGYRVRRELREIILFAVHNIIKDPPFSHLDLVSCRNLLIYLDRDAQSRVLEVMHFALNSESYLFLGSSESIEGATDLFAQLDKEHHIYQARAVPTRMRLPVHDPGPKPTLSPFRDHARPDPEERIRERRSFADLHQSLLEQFAPPSVVVNEDYDIVHLSDRAGLYMQLQGGEPTQNLLQLIKPELRMALRSALYQAVQNRTHVQAQGQKVSTDLGLQVVNIIVRPVFDNDDSKRGLILVLFEEGNPDPDVAAGTETTLSPNEPVARHLEDELMNTRGQLRATVDQYEIHQEELRASNEELQAMNEELRSTAEELETSKEELQSVNEELTTVNQELKIKIDELSQSNNDFANLINSTDIGTVFLDRNLRVNLFTPRARDAFNLIPSDIGRTLLHITNKLKYEGLLGDVEKVLQSLTSIEREVRSDDDHWYLMRILPYRTTDDRIEGVVITFTNITDSKRASQELERARGLLQTKVAERTRDLAEANESLSAEVTQRRVSEEGRLKLLSQLVAAQEQERRRLALDIHDQLGQQLTALRLKLESLKSQPGRSEALLRDLNDLSGIASQLENDVDFLAWELRPVALDDLGLTQALQNYVNQWGQHFNITAQFHSSGLADGRPLIEVENNLYRIAQEALNNVAKHSEATRVDVILERRDRHLALIIEDDGRGFEITDSGDRDTMGIASMRERAALLGGEFQIESKPWKGTTIFVRVPWPVIESQHSNPI